MPKVGGTQTGTPGPGGASTGHGAKCSGCSQWMHGTNGAPLVCTNPKCPARKK